MRKLFFSTALSIAAMLVATNAAAADECSVTVESNDAMMQ